MSDLNNFRIYGTWIPQNCMERERESKGLRVTPDFQLEFYGKGNGRFLTTLEKMAMTLVWDIVSI